MSDVHRNDISQFVQSQPQGSGAIAYHRENGEIFWYASRGSGLLDISSILLVLPVAAFAFGFRRGNERR